MSSARVRLSVIGLVLVVVGLAVLTLGFDAARVRSSTMEPAVRAGTVGLYTADPAPRRGDIVRFRAPWPEAAGFPPLVFRVAAVGGDAVRCCGPDGSLLVNGAPIPGRAPSRLRHQPFAIPVPTGRLFLVGDAVDASNDSTAHLDDHDGTVAVSAVEGRLVGVAWPPWRWSVPDRTRLGLSATPTTARGAPVRFLLASLATVAGSVLLLAAIGGGAPRGHRGRGDAGS